jgi:hypothetical protein
LISWGAACVISVPSFTYISARLARRASWPGWTFLSFVSSFPSTLPADLGLVAARSNTSVDAVFCLYFTLRTGCRRSTDFNPCWIKPNCGSVLNEKQYWTDSSLIKLKSPVHPRLSLLSRREGSEDSTKCCECVDARIAILFFFFVVYSA